MIIPIEAAKEILDRMKEEEIKSAMHNTVYITAKLSPDYHLGHLYGMKEVIGKLNINLYHRPTVIERHPVIIRITPLLMLMAGIIIGKVIT